MDFGLSDEQELLQRSARDFLSSECGPHVVRTAAESVDGRSSALEQKISAMGWRGLLVPESLGGLGLGMLEAAILLVEFGRALVPGPFLFSSILAIAAIAKKGSTVQKRRWLPRLLAGEESATLAWLEESGRIEPGGVEARARRRRSRWILDGRKRFVPYAATADLLIVPCRTTANGATGITVFLVERASPGITVSPLETIDRTRRLDEVELRGVDVAPEWVLGEPAKGWPILAQLLDVGAMAIAADSLGGAERTLEMAVEYSKNRAQFGRPVGSFQALKHMAAEMISEIEPTRSLLWYAAHTLDTSPRRAGRAVSMAKARACDVYARTSNRAVQMHGGIGFTWEHDLHFWFKRAKWNQVAFGDGLFHRERIASLGAY